MSKYTEELKKQIVLGGAFLMSKYTEELKKQIVLEHKIKHYGARVLQL